MTAGVTEQDRFRWRFETSGRVSVSPILDDGTHYVGSNDRYVYAIER